MSNAEITKIIERVLESLGISYDEVCVDDVDGGVSFCIKTPESHTLIGNDGTHLLAFNHIVKRIFEKNRPRGEKIPPFHVDVNDYQKRRNDELKNRVRIYAERARSFRTNVELDPMSSYERMVVHSVIADEKELTTESIGGGRERRVVIKYKESPSPEEDKGGIAA